MGTLKVLWRAALVVLLLGSIPLYVLQYTLVPRQGDFGFLSPGVIADAPGTRIAVAAVEPGSSAWRAGMRAGDAIIVSSHENGATLDYPLTGDHVTVPYVHAGTRRTAHLTATANTVTFGVPEYVRAAVVAFLLLFGLLVIVRAWQTEYGPLIATLLTADVVNPATDAIPYVFHAGIGPTLYVLNGWLSWISGTVDIFILLVLAARLMRRPPHGIRAIVAIAGLNAGVVALTAPIIAGFSIAGEAPVFLATLWLATYMTTSLVLPVLALPYAYAVSRDEGRARIGWLFWGFYPYCVGVLIVNLPVVVPQTATFLAGNADRWLAISIVARLLELSLPIALFYGLLLRRTVDIGFVVNRVAVYGLISVTVLAIFVLLEYVVGHFFFETGRAASLAVQLGVALVIGLSVRYLHTAFDRFVDHVLFAKRHHDETALRRFAQEAEAFTSAQTLLDRALETVCDHSEARGAAIYLCGDAGVTAVRASGDDFPRSLDRDDPLLVALRRWKEPVDTHTVKTVLPDGMAFPMIARGNLVGVLACRTKRDSTAFAPDEREPLAEVASSVARALDALSRERESSLDTIERSIQALAGTMVAIEDAVSAVKDAVVGNTAPQAR